MVLFSISGKIKENNVSKLLDGMNLPHNFKSVLFLNYE